MRVGGREAIPVDVRLVAATNLDLAEEVRAARFREDLYYRLSVFPIRVPSLRERRDDIPLLAAHFLRRAAADYGIEPPASIPPVTMRRLMEYDWPGNVRELENFIERGVIMHAGAKTISFDPDDTLHRRKEHDLVRLARAERWDIGRLEREYILAVLEEVNGHQGHAAELLGIDRRTLYRKLKQYRLAPTSRCPSAQDPRRPGDSGSARATPAPSPSLFALRVRVGHAVLRSKPSTRLRFAA